MFPFRSKQVADPAMQLNIDQLTTCLPGNQYAVPFNLAAGAGATTLVTVGPLGGNWIPFGAMNYAGAVAFQDTVTWAYRQTGPAQIEIALHNNGAGAAVGTFYFTIYRLPV